MISVIQNEWIMKNKSNSNGLLRFLNCTFRGCALGIPILVLVTHAPFALANPPPPPLADDPNPDPPLAGTGQYSPRIIISAPFGTSFQVNVNGSGQNIVGDAANEPSMCLDPNNPYHIAIGWRQFDSTNSNFRQSGVAYTINGGLNWTFPGNLEPGTFRSDPVLASDANGVFYYLGLSNVNTFACDLLRSTSGGATWQSLGSALGGDKEWMAIDTTTGPGRGNIYQVWRPFYNVYTNDQHAAGDPDHIFTRSTDGGASWMPAIGLPHTPYFGTLDIGPDGELYMFGTAYDIVPFVVNRSTNAQNPAVTP